MLPDVAGVWCKVGEQPSRTQTLSVTLAVLKPDGRGVARW